SIQGFGECPSSWPHFERENQAGGGDSVESLTVRRGRSHFFRSPRHLLRTAAGELDRNCQSFFFLDGRPGQPEGGSSALRRRRGKRSGFQTAVGVEARFFHGCQSGGL